MKWAQYCGSIKSIPTKWVHIRRHFIKKKKEVKGARLKSCDKTFANIPMHTWIQTMLTSWVLLQMKVNQLFNIKFVSSLQSSSYVLLQFQSRVDSYRPTNKIFIFDLLKSCTSNHTSKSLLPRQDISQEEKRKI